MILGYPRQRVYDIGTVVLSVHQGLHCIIIAVSVYVYPDPDIFFYLIFNFEL